MFLKKNRKTFCLTFLILKLGKTNLQNKRKILMF